MTREEVIENLKGLLESNYVDSFDDAENEALEVAIQALSQEPCEDAISREWLKTAIHNFYYGLKHTPTEEDIQAYIDVAPPVTQKPIDCDDAISRQAAKRALEDRFMELQKRHDDKRYETNYCLNTILELPSVTPQQKYGEWIYDKTIENWKCSECGETPKTLGYCGTADFMAEHFKFCNHCGVKMVEPQESEVRNEGISEKQGDR